jgi:hypothetical protein
MADKRLKPGAQPQKPTARKAAEDQVQARTAPPPVEELLHEDDDVQEQATASHTHRALDPARQDREMEDRDVTEDRELTDDERLDMFRFQLAQDRLPSLPNLPGFHMIWLSTTNGGDTIPMRLQVGYELLKAHEVPGWEHAVQSEGMYQGHIMVNEMIAAKLPTRLYEKYMRHFHHDEPMREQHKLTANLDGLRDEAEKYGAKLIEGDGMKALRENVRAPAFSTQEERG